MRKMMGIIIVICAIGSASSLITNGAFEQDLTIGWQSYKYSTMDTITRGIGYEPDPDYELYVYRDYGSGYCKVWQTVDIPTTDLSFSVKAKLWAFDNNADTLCWAASAIRVIYLNQNSVVLGETRICYKTAPCPWAGSSTLHLINSSDTLWHTYAFNINTELANLPGVTPSQVRKIQIAAYDTTAHTC